MIRSILSSVSTSSRLEAASVAVALESGEELVSEALSATGDIRIAASKENQFERGRKATLAKRVEDLGCSLLGAVL